MSDPTDTASVRPMTQDDYSQGQPVRQARAAGDHPTRDLVMGAVIGAVALWAVPKALDFIVGGGLFGQDEWDLRD